MELAVCGHDHIGGTTDIKMVRQNRGAAGAQASAEGTRTEAPIPSPADYGVWVYRGFTGLGV